MAFKKYGYYLKGNKIAVIEQSDATSSGNLAVAHCTVDPTNNTTKDTCEAAGGQWIPGSSGSTSSYSEYMSPTESVADGLEIQYAYSPSYRLYTNTAVDVNRFYINGWTVINGYLTFLRSRYHALADWTASPHSVITDPASTNPHIVVNGSERWNGLHKVQTRGTEGQLVTYTRVSEALPYWEDQGIDFSSGEEIFDGLTGALHLADHFSAGDYIWISGSPESAVNVGLFSVDSVTVSATGASSKVKLGTKYMCPWSTQSDTMANGLNTEYSAAAAFSSDTDETDINIYKAHRDFCYIDTVTDVLNDESDTIDLSRYQANAVVYYLKAKLAEDAGDMEKREFFLREFKRQLEKGNSALKRGPYMVQGFREMR